MQSPRGDEILRRLRDHWRTALLLGLLVLAIGLAVISGLTPQGVLIFIEDNSEALRHWIQAHPWLAALAYALFYTLAVTISLPGALWFTIGAGYLLGAWMAIPVSLIGVTLGASNIFLIARYIAGEGFHARFRGRIARFAEGFRRDDFTYMILLRITPVPFFLVNVAAALLGARLKSYVAGTFIGAIAPTVLYANLGAGLGELVMAGVRPGLADILRPQFLIVLGMALLFAFTPLLHRRWARRPSINDRKSQ